MTARATRPTPSARSFVVDAQAVMADAWRTANQMFGLPLLHSVSTSV